MVTLITVAQSMVNGTIIDSETNEPLIGATVLQKGTNTGTITDVNGSFHLTVPNDATLVISYLGYESIDLNAGSDLSAISMQSSSVGLSEVLVIANIAIDRKTPVAVSTIEGDVIAAKVGNQEFPEILRSTPSVYVTKSGGGFGDARIAVRGFSQENTAVLINGIPVNDMENGRVFWSNWAGLSDVASSMQIQRGLGASRLAIASVGGTVNVVTNPLDRETGGSLQINTGNDGYLKYGTSYSTGLMDNGWGATMAFTRTTGRGYVDATYIDAYSYFATIGKKAGNHQFVLTAFGAPQKHGQRSFAEDLDTYVDYDTATDGDFASFIDGKKVSDFDNRSDIGDAQYSPIHNVRYNSDWGKDVNGDIYHIRENFYHKPQVSLNHYWDINKDMFLSTSAYYSVGRGGGTGDRGNIGAFGGGVNGGTWGFRDSEGLVDAAGIFNWNRGNDVGGVFPSPGHNQDADNGFVAGEGRDEDSDEDGEKEGFYNKGIIKRASMNSHNWAGMLSSLEIGLSDNLTLTTGVDLRRYIGLHYRKVVDLFGNDSWLETRNVNRMESTVDIDGNGYLDRRESNGTLITKTNEYFGNPGDENKINYDNDGIVGWAGWFGELEYSQDHLTSFVSIALSNTGYKRVDRFNYTLGSDLEKTETISYLGYIFKGGANYNLNTEHNVFFNAGYISKAPIFDTVFPNFNNVDINTEAENEKITSFEIGYGYTSQSLVAKLNLYTTSWADKSAFSSFRNDDGSTGFANVLGIGALHQGIELELAYKPIQGLRFDGMMSLGDWQWKENVSADIFDDNNVLVSTVEVFSDGLKVGYAAQTTISLAVDYQFDFGLGFDASWRYFDDLYADYDPADRDDRDDIGVQPLQLPSYSLLNAGLSYKIPLSKNKLTFRFNVNNLTDALYVAQANDADKLQDANGYFGFGRTWNAGLRYKL